MENNNITGALREIALMLEKCADDVPYEISAKNQLYFRMVETAKEARALMKDLQEQ